MYLQPVARIRRDEGAAPAVLLDTEVPLHRPAEHGLELVLLERDAKVVDARHAPVARLDDDVDRAALELRQSQLETVAFEPLPGAAGLDRDVVVADSSVPGDEIEAELHEVAPFDVPDLGRDQVVVEEAHPSSVPTWWQSRRA